MSTRNIFFYSALVLLGAVGGLVSGLKLSSGVAQYHQFAELRVHLRALERPDLDPQLREYLKSRIYFLAGFLEPDDLRNHRFNFGPVNEQILRGASGIKGPETELENYQRTMRKHPQPLRL